MNPLHSSINTFVRSSGHTMGVRDGGNRYRYSHQNGISDETKKIIIAAGIVIPIAGALVAWLIYEAWHVLHKEPQKLNEVLELGCLVAIGNIQHPDPATGGESFLDVTMHNDEVVRYIERSYAAHGDKAVYVVYGGNEELVCNAEGKAFQSLEEFQQFRWNDFNQHKDHYEQLFSGTGALERSFKMAQFRSELGIINLAKDLTVEMLAQWKDFYGLTNGEALTAFGISPDQAVAATSEKVDETADVGNQSESDITSYPELTDIESYNFPANYDDSMSNTSHRNWSDLLDGSTSNDSDDN